MTNQQAKLGLATTGVGDEATATGGSIREIPVDAGVSVDGYHGKR